MRASPRLTGSRRRRAAVIIIILLLLLLELLLALARPALVEVGLPFSIIHQKMDSMGDWHIMDGELGLVDEVSNLVVDADELLVDLRIV